MLRDGSDPTFRLLLRLLVCRGIGAVWNSRQDPLSDLRSELRMLVADEPRRVALGQYLDQNPIVEQSMRTLLAHLAMAAGVRWQETAPILRPLARQGWHIGRWLPTFLLIDGPLGRLFRDAQSPVSQYLRSDHKTYRLLAEVRDAFNHDLFRRVRNGFGHWSFIWDDSEPDPHIRIIHWEKGTEEADLSLLEAEAFHFFTFCVVEAVDEEIFKSRGRDVPTGG